MITALLREKVLFATFRGGDVMQMEVLQGILIPFLGTSLGSACVLFMRKKPDHMLQRALTGFAAGVMVAASVRSLLMGISGEYRKKLNVAYALSFFESLFSNVPIFMMLYILMSILNNGFSAKTIVVMSFGVHA